MKITSRELMENSRVISIDEGRHQLFNKVFDFHGLHPLPRLFNGVKDEKNTGVQNCYLSHRGVILDAMRENLPYVCIFEDDAYPRDGIVDFLDYYLSDVPSECNVMILGYCSLYQFMKYDEKLYKHATVWASHAYILFSHAYKQYLQFLDYVGKADPWQYTNNEIFQKDSVFLPNKNLFIQHVFNKSMNNYIGYLWNIGGIDLTNEEIFDRGFSPIENILGK